MNTGKIIDPKKLEAQDLETEFGDRLNTLLQNALWRGMTKIQVIGLIDTMKVGLQMQTISLVREPGKPEKKE